MFFPAFGPHDDGVEFGTLGLYGFRVERLRLMVQDAINKIGFEGSGLGVQGLDGLGFGFRV